MKKYLIICVLLACILPMFAQEISIWQNFRASALTPSGKIHLKWETLTNPLDTLEIIYKQNNQLITVNPSNQLLEFSSSINNPDADVPSIALRSMMENYGILTPLKLANNTPITPSLLVKACNDSLNEAVTAGDTKLDIKSFHFAYNDNQMIAGIINQNGAYPNGVTVLGPFYVYGAGFLNPENIMDSTAYAMINANIMGFMTPGLYKLHGGNFTDFQNFDFSAVQRVGDISVSTNNGMLVMKCDWDTITNDVDFGTWPSISKSLVFVPFIMKVNVSDLQNINGDIGSPAAINFTDLSFASSNTLPVLNNHTVFHVENTSVVSVKYTDANRNYPLYSYFKIGETEYPMTPQSLDFNGSVIFTTIIPNLDWSEGVCYFSDDSTNVVNYTIINEVGNDENPTQISNNLAIYPNPFNLNNQNVNIKSEQKIESLAIYNIRGQKIKHFNITSIAPTNKVIWNGKDDNGNKLSSGIYFAKASNSKSRMIKKFLILN